MWVIAGREISFCQQISMEDNRSGDKEECRPARKRDRTTTEREAQSSPCIVTGASFVYYPPKRITPDCPSRDSLSLPPMTSSDQAIPKRSRKGGDRLMRAVHLGMVETIKIDWIHPIHYLRRERLPSIACDYFRFQLSLQGRSRLCLDEASSLQQVSGGCIL